MKNSIPQRLTQLRQAMDQHGIAACLIPTADPHLSEYLPKHWAVRAWFSGFSGSAGTLIVMADYAGLWTDSRYFEQAERELAGTGIELQRLRVAHTPEHLSWLAEHLQTGQCLACSGDMLSRNAAQQLQDSLKAKGIHTDFRTDLPGWVWKQRPALPTAAIVEHPAAFACAHRGDRLQALRTAMQQAGASHHLLSSLDDIAWITQLRGGDIEYNPVFLAHLLIGPDSIQLFVDPAKLSDAGLVAALHADGIVIRPYDAIDEALLSLTRDAQLLFDPGKICMSLALRIPDAVQQIEAPNPSTAMKACKSPCELDHWREVMRRDGAALVRAFRQIDDRVRAGKTLTELDVDEIVTRERRRESDFVGPSFATIAGYAGNAALPHYQAVPEHPTQLQPHGLLLVDSGGQYQGGTTDITRVWSLGPITDQERLDYTVVLQGMIALSRAYFPSGASGPQLDALARAPIWAEQADYGHGTGHGVGYFLNVHEGPHGIRPPSSGSTLVPLQPGMVVSIEPGLYRPGQHGIRHENLVVVSDSGSSEFGPFLAFETLSLCPFDTRALQHERLNATERNWLNTYHARVFEVLAPRLQAADRSWLEARCAPLSP